MLRRAKQLLKDRIDAKDREIGALSDLLFDDTQWTVRYLAVRTAQWMEGRELLLAPQAVRHFNESDRTIVVDVTSEQLQNSPDIQVNPPVARQDEWKLLMFYNWMPSVQMGSGQMPGPNMMPSQAEMTGMESNPNGDSGSNIQPPPDELDYDPHLHSAKAVAGYRIHARDDEFGSVDDVVVDLDHWVIRYIVADTRRWLPSTTKLLAVDWIDSIDHNERTILTGLDKSAIKNAPDFDFDEPLTRAFEARLYEYYERQAYWPR